MAYEVWLPPIDDQRAITAWVDQIDQTRVSRVQSEQRIGSLVPAALNHAYARLS